MDASAQNPIYTVYIVSGSNKYNVTPALEEIEIKDQQRQMAKSVTITLLNVQVNGTWLTSLFDVRDRVYIYANDGEKNDEVFRGFIWTRGYGSSLETRNLKLRCYDQLIYFQESEESAFFASGKSTKDVIKSLCDTWGVSLEYSYESITHSKLALRGTLSDIITADVLDLVKERTGKKYAILSEKDVVKVVTVGQNTTVYQIKAGQNAISTTSEISLDGVTTKVVILGKADDDDRQSVEATVTGNTSKYGTLQKIINRSENTSLEDSKKEAQTIIDEDGTPKWIYDIEATDIPWIRKGDKVQVNAGDITRSVIVVGIDRSISNEDKTMTLTCERE